ncbi:MAG: Ig-like domain repeat protein [Lachnospiraceae bacterium]|nr:Ig-like domain repeat protein [Lachnospiraceae bacterium]
MKRIFYNKNQKTRIVAFLLAIIMMMTPFFAHAGLKKDSKAAQNSVVEEIESANLQPVWYVADADGNQTEAVSGEFYKTAVCGYEADAEISIDADVGKLVYGYVNKADKAGKFVSFEGDTNVISDTGIYAPAIAYYEKKDTDNEVYVKHWTGTGTVKIDGDAPTALYVLKEINQNDTSITPDDDGNLGTIYISPKGWNSEFKLHILGNDGEDGSGLANISFDGEEQTLSGTTALTPALTSGASHTITLTDNVGNTATVTFTFIADGTNPAISDVKVTKDDSDTQIGNNAKAKADSVTISAKVTDDNIKNVILHLTTEENTSNPTMTAAGDIYSYTIDNIQSGDYTFSIEAEDKAGNKATFNDQKFTIDNAPPVMSGLKLQYKEANGDWTDADDENGAYVINPNKNRQYRLFVTATDSSEVNQVRIKDGGSFSRIWQWGWPTNNYEYNFNVADLVNVSEAVIEAEDNLGNIGSVTAPVISLVNADITVSSSKYGWDGEIQTSLDAIPDYISDKHDFTVYVSSLYDIDASATVLTNGTDTISCKPIDTGRIEYDEKSGKYVTPVTFVIGDMPASTLFNNYTLKVYDTAQPDPNSNETFALKAILLDLDRPYLKEVKVKDEDGTIITDFTKWYKSATLSYVVSGGDNLDDTLKSPLESASYVIGNAVTNGTTSIDVPENVNEVEGEFDIPESDASTGTVITFEAKDKAGNSIQTTDSSNVKTVKVDGTNPEISSVKVNNTVLSKEDGTPNDCTIVPVVMQTPIEVVVRDNLSIDSILVSMNDADGNPVALSNDSRQFNEYEALKQGSGAVQETLRAQLNISGLEDGKYSLSVKVVDKAGNETEISGYEFIINTEEPIILDKATGKAPVSDKSWHNDSEFTKTFVVNLDSEGAQLKTITYTIEDSKNNVTEVKVVDNGFVCDEHGNITWGSPWAGKTREFNVNIPEAAAASGTKLTITVIDWGENRAERTVHYLLDKTRPYSDNLMINNDDILSNPIADNNPEISLKVGDALTLSQVSLSVRGPKGTKSKTFDYKYNASSTSGIDRTFKKKLSDILGKNIPDGQYTVVATAKDKAGNTSVSNRISFHIDKTKPTVSVKAVSGTASKKTKNPYYYKTDVGVELTYTEKNMNKVTVTDNGNAVQNLEWKPVMGADGTYRAKITVSTEGAHKIAISGIDKTGNRSGTKQISFVVDKSLPKVTAVVNGTTVYTDNMGQLMLTAATTVAMTVSDANIDAEDNYVQVIKKVPDKDEMTTQYAKTSNLNMSFDEEADYVVNFYAIDKADNKSSVKTVNFRIDKAAPALSISGAAGSGTSSSSAVATFTVREAFWWDATGTVSIYRKAGDANAEALYKTIEITPTAYETSVSETLTETGVYRFEMEASDKVGHTANLSQTFTIDREAPVITLSGVNDYDKTNKNVEFSAQITDEFYTSKKVTITGTRTDETGKVNNISFSGFSQSANPTIISENFTEDGIYDVTVVSSDAAGNEQTSHVHFTIDKTAPVIGDMSKYDGKVLTAFNWDINADDIVSDLTVCTVEMYLNGSEYDGVSDIEDGSYVLRIVASDELGHTSEKEISFELDTKAPVFIVTGVEKDEVKDEPYTIEVSLQLGEDMLSEVILNGKQMNISENVCRFDVTEKGDYTLELKAVDNAGNEATDTIEFRYGQEKSMWWLWLIILLAILLLAVIFIIIAKRRKDKR